MQIYPDELYIRMHFGFRNQTDIRTPVKEISQQSTEKSTIYYGTLFIIITNIFYNRMELRLNVSEHLISVITSTFLTFLTRGCRKNRNLIVLLHLHAIIVRPLCFYYLRNRPRRSML